MGQKRSAAMAASEGSTWNQNSPESDTPRAAHRDKAVGIQLGRERMVHVEGLFSTTPAVDHGSSSEILHEGIEMGTKEGKGVVVV